MEVKEVQELLKGIADENKAAIENTVQQAVEGLVKADELKDMLEAQGVDKKMGEIEKALEAQSEAIRKMEATEKAGETLEQKIEKVSKELAEVISSRKGKVSFTIDKTDVTRGSVTNHTLAMRLPDIGQIAYKATKMEAAFNTGSVGANSNGVIRYVDQSAVTRAAAEVAEAGTKAESAITWQEYTLPIEVLADTIPITMQAANDVAFMASEIRNFLLNNLRLRLDTQLYAGDGVTPNIFGIYTKADTFTAVNSGIGGANLYDLILKVQEDIVKDTQYNPNIAFVSYADYNSMLLVKEATTNAYITPGWSMMQVGGSQPAMNVNGITVIPSASVTANTLVVGDFNFATLYSLGGINVDMGWINAQFVENMMTLRAERQVGMLVRTAHTDAFRKVASVSAALTTLATAPV